MNRHHQSLELHKVLDMLAEHCGCEETKQAARAITPCVSLREAQQQLRTTADAHSLSNRYGTPSIHGVPSCRDFARRAQAGGLLSPRELLDSASILRTSRGLLQWKRQSKEDGVASALDPFFAQLDGNKALEDAIRTAILSEEEISDRASAELASIRRKIRAAEQRARDQLDKITRSATTQKYLQEAIITIRNNRFVVPVKAEHRGDIKGLVHDTSASGATLFVEPMAVVELNNQIRELQSKEQHEIDRILRALSAQVGDEADTLLNDYETILLLDLVFAKTRLADRMRASVPTLIASGETQLIKARHPLISAEEIVPIDLYIGGAFDTLVITGPNTGGKTVALKTLGLLTLMAMCGLMLPVADDSTVCFYQRVLADIGDEQSIEQSLSTFSGHMTNLVSILEEAQENTLVLIDELGAGTDPVEGAALGVAIIDDLRRRGANVAATTHYAEIKMYALQTDGVENASCEFDVATLRPTYRLLIGVPGRSNAFAISERLGLPITVIDAAREQMSHESTRFEDVVSGLEETRQQLEREKAAAEHYRREALQAKQEAENIQQTLEDRIETEMKKAREKARQLVAQVEFRSEALMAELEELKKQKDRDDFSSSVAETKSIFNAYLRELEETADPVQPKKKRRYRLPRKLQRGDRVFLDDLGAEGTVITEPDNSGYVQVQTGILKTKAKVNTLRLLEDDRSVTLDGSTSGIRQAVGGAKSSATPEVDLRGMNADEALMELDRYLDTSVLSGLKTVTVIHGKGTGVLRAAVQKRLRKHKSVKEFRLGTYGEGESGVTIVELR